MGHENALPQLFARLDARGDPGLNLGLIGALALD